MKMLKPRQFEILLLATQGLVQKEIAQRLHISVRTVKYHCANIYNALGMSAARGHNSAVVLVAWWAKNGAPASYAEYWKQQGKNVKQEKPAGKVIPIRRLA